MFNGETVTNHSSSNFRCRAFDAFATFLGQRESSSFIASLSARSLLEKLPCFHAFWLPLGAPVAFPPCIRHLPFAIDPFRHGFPLLREGARRLVDGRHPLHASSTYRFSSHRCGTASLSAASVLRIGDSGAWVTLPHGGEFNRILRLNSGKTTGTNANPK
jgi:hypothetical protein